MLLLLSPSLRWLISSSTWAKHKPFHHETDFWLLKGEKRVQGSWRGPPEQSLSEDGTPSSKLPPRALPWNNYPKLGLASSQQSHPNCDKQFQDRLSRGTPSPDPGSGATCIPTFSLLRVSSTMAVLCAEMRNGAMSETHPVLHCPLVDKQVNIPLHCGCEQWKEANPTHEGRERNLTPIWDHPPKGKLRLCQVYQ